MLLGSPDLVAVVIRGVFRMMYDFCLQKQILTISHYPLARGHRAVQRPASDNPAPAVRSRFLRAHFRHALANTFEQSMTARTLDAIHAVVQKKNVLLHVLARKRVVDQLHHFVHNVIDIRVAERFDFRATFTDVVGSMCSARSPS